MAAPTLASDTPSDTSSATRTAPAPEGVATVPGTRGRRHSALGRMRSDVPVPMTVGLSAIGVLLLLGGWWALAESMGASDFLLPTPPETWDAFRELLREGTLREDLTASLRRIGVGYAISMLIGVVLGVMIASFRAIEAFSEAPIGFLRYIPAGALTPLFLLWLGIDESPKVALIVVGTVFFNTLMIADVARAVPQELVNAASTLGAGRFTTLRRVILPHSWPGIVDVARINLAAAWVMLVVAEMLAAQEGLAFRVVRAQRFRAVDTMFAVLIVFGLIGLVSDLALRQIRKRTAPWSEGSR